MISTLIVEDDYHVATIHAAYVRRVKGFGVVGHASTLVTARAEIGRLAPELVLLDLYLPDGHGLDLLRETLERTDRPDFLVITAARDMASVRAAMQLGTVHYLVKPFRFAQLEERLTTYRNLHARLARVSEAEQHEVDALYGLLRGPAPLPKGQSGPTMARIREHLRGTGQDLSATEIAARIGISRSTAQRYLAELARQGTVELRLHYGAAGRPEHRYRIAAGVE
ncbi:MAG TPA: response regulator [Solirubrobacteraceae bacterium]